MGKDQELLDAARNGNVLVVEKILGQRAKRSGPLASLRRGPGANVQDSSGYSALHHAALNGHKEVVKLLLQHEASTNIVDSKGSSPLHLAAWSGNSEIVQLILTQGPSVPNVNLTTKDNETALHCAAQYGHTEVVSQLLHHQCDPGIRNNRGECALDLAAQYGRLETVELLLSTNPELIESLRSSCSSLIFPHTPLHLASRNGHRAVVEALLAAGVNVNTRTAAGTAMHEAALCGKMEVVRTLLDHGIDLSIRDSRHNTVLTLLSQFPEHVTHDITAVIKRHRLSSGIDSDADSENYPPHSRLYGDSLGSPYDYRQSDDISPGDSGSPTRWQLYHRPRDDDRRLASGMDNGALYQTPPLPRCYPNNGDYHQHHHQQHYNASENLSLALPPAYGGGNNHRDIDQLSVSSSSSFGGKSPRDRHRCLPPSDPQNSPGIYLPMAPIHSPGSANSKISNGLSTLQPTPPKKPPRRNLSISPTHLQTQLSLQSDLPHSAGGNPSNYEYLFLARSGPTRPAPIDLEELQMRREKLRHVTRSVDQYVDMRSTFKSLDEEEPGEEQSDTCDRLNKVNGKFSTNSINRRANNNNKLTRRNNNINASFDKAYENHEVNQSSPCSESGANQDRTYVSSAFLTLKSSQESLLDDEEDAEDDDKDVDEVEMRHKLQPTSPTHYPQPPTPDHPPPTAMQAEKSIHERIRPLSQIYKRSSRDIETEIEEDLFVQFPSTNLGSLEASSGSLSSVSLSDKSISTDNNVEEYFGDVPFAGKQQQHQQQHQQQQHESKQQQTLGCTA